MAICLMVELCLAGTKPFGPGHASGSLGGIGVEETDQVWS